MASYAPRSRLHLHHTLPRLIFRRADWAHLTHSNSLVAVLALLVRHYVSGKDALLRLLAVYFEGSQRTEQFVHSARRHVLALINCCMILIAPVHRCIHMGSYYVAFLVHLGALLSSVTYINRIQLAFLELHTLIYKMSFALIAMSGQQTRGVTSDATHG